MSNGLDKLMKSMNNGSAMTPEEYKIKLKFEEGFRIPRKGSEDRKGLHGSAIIAEDSKFCLREQVLSLIYKRNDQKELPVKLLQIFEEGNRIHEKFQDLVDLLGISEGIEARGYQEEFDLYMTPDFICMIDDRMYVGEIKSCNMFAYKGFIKKRKHKSGNIQLQFYMHFFGIPNGFVIVEDKNSQEFDIFVEKYDYKIIEKYIVRLNEITKAKEKFDESGKLPRRCKSCDSWNCKHAENCGMRDACFKKSLKKI